MNIDQACLSFIQSDSDNFVDHNNYAWKLIIFPDLLVFKNSAQVTEVDAISTQFSMFASLEGSKWLNGVVFSFSLQNFERQVN